MAPTDADMKELVSRLNGHENNISDLSLVVFGNDTMHIPGLAERIENIEKMLQELVSWQRDVKLLLKIGVGLLTVITDSRNERLDGAEGAVPRFLWFVLIAGGAITLGYPAFFGATNLGAQVLMTASLAALVSLSLALALAFDYPFTGGEHISVAPFDQALQQMPETLSAP